MQNVAKREKGRPAPEAKQLESGLLGAERQAFPCKVIEMLRQEQWPASSENSCLEAVQIRHVRKEIAFGLQQQST
jgi:hypothetical protein